MRTAHFWTRSTRLGPLKAWFDRAGLFIAMAALNLMIWQFMRLRDHEASPGRLEERFAGKVRRPGEQRGARPGRAGSGGVRPALRTSLYLGHRAGDDDVVSDDRSRSVQP